MLDEDAVRSASFPTRGDDGAAFFGLRNLRALEKQRRRVLRKMNRGGVKPECESVSADYIIKKQPAPYGKNPDKCDVLKPPDIECTRAIIRMPGSKKGKKPSRPHFESRFIRSNNNLKLLKYNSEV